MEGRNKINKPKKRENGIDEVMRIKEGWEVYEGREEGREKEGNEVRERLKKR